MYCKNDKKKIFSSMSITGNKKLLTIIEQAKNFVKPIFLNIRKFIFKEKSLIKLDSPFLTFC